MSPRLNEAQQQDPFVFHVKDSVIFVMDWDPSAPTVATMKTTERPRTRVRTTVKTTKSRRALKSLLLASAPNTATLDFLLITVQSAKMMALQINF
jgi:hypothetical protein